MIVYKIILHLINIDIELATTAFQRGSALWINELETS